MAQTALVTGLYVHSVVARATLAKAVLAEEIITQHEQAILQVVGLLITGAASVLVALVSNRSSRKVDASATKLATPEPGNGNLATSWKDLAQEWEDRYREEVSQHALTKARLALYEQSVTEGNRRRGWADVVGKDVPTAEPPSGWKPPSSDS